MAYGRSKNAKKTPAAAAPKAAPALIEAVPTTLAKEAAEEDEVGKAKRLPPGSVQLQFAGELVLARNPNRSLDGLFRRYEALFEALANMERHERLINYKFLAALILTSHAKKSTSIEERKQLFDLKNSLFLQMANDRELRKKLGFMYLVSKNFRVTSFCPACTTSNEAAGLKRHDWKFCKDCQVDRNFYNVLSMHHKFADGSATLFLSHDLLDKINGLQIKKRAKLDDIKEEALFQRYHYNVRNLDVFDLKSVRNWHGKLMAMP